jgi:hypothetical protein
LSYTPSIWDSHHLHDLNLRSKSKRDGLKAKTLWGHAQYAANRILKDGCVLRIGTIDHPLDRTRVAVLFLRAVKAAMDHQIPRPEAYTIFGLAKYLSGARAPGHAKLKGDFAVRIGLTSYKTIVKHGRKTD